jgi:hypothetical protein
MSQPSSFRGKAAGLEPSGAQLRTENLDIGLRSWQQHRDSGFVRLRRTPGNDVFVASRAPRNDAKEAMPRADETIRLGAEHQEARAREMHHHLAGLRIVAADCDVLGG